MPLDGCAYSYGSAHTLDGGVHTDSCAHTIGEKGRAGVKRRVESPKSATFDFNIVDAHTAAMQCSGMLCDGVSFICTR